jgi:hypothetical protein
VSYGNDESGQVAIVLVHDEDGDGDDHRVDHREDYE